jgi:hypothetical protein
VHDSRRRTITEPFLSFLSCSKYKFMEQSMGRTKVNTKGKIPEIERTLELVRFLKEKQVRTSDPFHKDLAGVFQS